MSTIKLVLFTSSLLLVAGQALAAPAHLPHPGRTATEHRAHQHQADQQGKTHAGHGHGHHGHGHHGQQMRQKL